MDMRIFFGVRETGDRCLIVAFAGNAVSIFICDHLLHGLLYGVEAGVGVGRGLGCYVFYCDADIIGC